MKRFPILGVLLLIPAMFLFVAVGCDKGPTPAKHTDNKTSPNVGSGDKKDLAAPGENPATVTGTVKFKGDFKPVALAALNAHKEADQCKKGAKPADLIEQTWIVDKDNGLANVVVSIEAGDGFQYKIDDKFRDGFKDKNVILDQPCCAYRPHVIALYGKVQPLVVKNSADFAHNTNIKFGPKNIPSENKLVPSKGAWAPLFPDFESAPIEISCQLHGFMAAKLVTFKHPYFAVTDEKGAFKIEGVPSGTELVVYAWHESMAAKKEISRKTFTKGDNTLDAIEIAGK